MIEELGRSGCLFVTSAFESVNDAVLSRLDKGHTAADAAAAVDVLRRNGIDVRSSWMPFTPWTTVEDLVAILDFVAEHDLVTSVDPVQYTIRLLLPRGSLLLDRPDFEVGPFDEERLTYTWRSPLDALHAELAALVEAAGDAAEPPDETYARVRAAVGAPPIAVSARAEPPRLTESWFCCAEPTMAQNALVSTAAVSPRPAAVAPPARRG